MRLSRVIGPLFAVMLFFGIGYGIFISAGRKSEEQTALREASQVKEIRGMIGSEKEGFFADPRVAAELRKHGIVVKVDKVGSREISARDLTGYDFGFPAGAPGALLLKQKSKAAEMIPTFYTPMAVATWKSLIPTLEAEGIVRRENNAHYALDMQKLMKLMNDGTRWRDLPSNTAYKTGKSILINSTDVRKSNSAAMYLALASYLANGNNVVKNSDEADTVIPQLAALFLRQGLQEASSAGPFEDYITMGVGKAPIVMIYESQFLEHQAKRDTPNPDMVLLYPQPTIFTKHVLVPFNENGAKLGRLLADDPALQKLATEYGYRTANVGQFHDFLKSEGIEAPETLVDVIDPPSFEILERMIQAIEAKYQ
jgi:hypothetical protein